MLNYVNSTYFQNLLGGLSVGALVLNTAGDVYAANQAAADILDLPLPDLKGPGLEDKLKPRTVGGGELDDLMFLVRRGDNSKNYLRLMYRHPKRGVLHLNLSTTVLTEAGKVFGVLVEIMDTTEIIRMHEQEKQILHERNRLMHERVRSLNKLAQAVAHQIRNPATAIGGLAMHLLKHKPPQDPESKPLSYILDGCQRLDDIVRAVHSYNQEMEMSLAPGDPAEAVRRALEELEKAAGDLPSIIWRLELAPMSARLDMGWAARALKEIMRNAWESLPGQGGEVVVRSLAYPAKPGLSISDTGRGIEPGHLPFVFDPFFTTKAVGVGMGLSRARRILRQMGGDVEITSAPGQGSEALIHFAPAIESEDNDEI